MSAGVYARITARIVEALEQGVRPWMKPWDAEHAAGSVSRPLRHNGVPYSGINVILLWWSAVEQGFAAPIWMTSRQAEKLGGSVKKGEDDSFVIHAFPSTRIWKNAETGQTEYRRNFFVSGYSVFNVEQIEGLPAKFHATARPKIDPVERIEHVERFFAATGADIRHGGDRAYYRVDADYVQMPPFEYFEDAESYYATLAHECGHWTRHPSRLDRDFGQKQWGDKGYAMEELVVELGSAFLAADLGITPEVREDHAAYIASWLETLKNDRRAIFIAASLAQKAVDFLNGLQPKEEGRERAAA